MSKSRWLLPLALLCGHVHAAAGDPLAPCSDRQLLGVAPGPEEIELHRQFDLPVIDRPNVPRMQPAGQQVQLRIDTEGRPLCFRAKPLPGPAKSQPLSRKRLAWTAQAASWRYAPFIRNGQPTEAVVEEYFREQIPLARHRSMPKVSPEQVRIRLDGSSCLGTCPSFSVEVHGDGTVIYEGERYVDVLGKHTFRVAEADVAWLIQRMRDLDLWSMNRTYDAMVMDSPGTQLEITLGAQKHTIWDGDGKDVGMPVAVTAFQRDVARVARVNEWINLSPFALQKLKQEGFPFRSREGADLLARALSNRDGHDEQAMLDVIDLGVPLDAGQHGKQVFAPDPPPPTPMIELALDYHRARVVDALLERNVLDVKTPEAQAAWNEAFRSAIASGNLAWVERIWNAGMQGKHPSLWFDQRQDFSDGLRRVSVIMLIERRPEDVQPWDGLAVARWLVAQGCDARARDANGATLLHIAAKTGDVAFVRWALDRGLPVSGTDEDDIPALGWTKNEDVAMLLIEAGADASKLDGNGLNFREFAEYNHWARVVAWMDSQ